LAQPIEIERVFERMPSLTPGSASMRAAFGVGKEIKAAASAALKGRKQEDAGQFKT